MLKLVGKLFTKCTNANFKYCISFLKKYDTKHVRVLKAFYKPIQSLKDFKIYTIQTMSKKCYPPINIFLLFSSFYKLISSLFFQGNSNEDLNTLYEKLPKNT